MRPNERARWALCVRAAGGGREKKAVCFSKQIKDQDRKGQV